MAFFQDTQVLNIVAATPLTYTLPIRAPLSGLTIWAVGKKPTNAITTQAKVAGVDFGAAVVIPNAGPVGMVVFASGGALTENFLLPMPRSAGDDATPFTFSVTFTPGAAAEKLTLYAVAEEF